MRVFVVGTPRSGTCTFYQACKYITNYTVSHERKLPNHDYPNQIMPERRSVLCNEFRDDHIYIDHTLYPIMGTLISKYPDARWIHLIRSKEDCVRSLCNNFQRDLVRLQKLYFWPMSVEETAEAYHAHTNQNIWTMLENVRYLQLWLEGLHEDWKLFWDFIGAEGDFEASRNTWKRKYNSTEKRGRENYVEVK